MKKFNSIMVMAGFALLAACGNKKVTTHNNTPDTSGNGHQNTVDTTVHQSNVAEFNADSAYSYIEKQLSFGPRIPNSKGHVACGDYLIKTLKGWADEVIVQKASVTAYTGDVLKIRNIIARINPKSTNRIALFAHWDTRPFADRDETTKNQPVPGADDGASGVAVLMEVVRQLQQNKPTIGVDIVLFDGEDYGNSGGDPNSYCLGSQYWSRNNPIAGYTAKYGILLDMVGGRGASFLREGVSMQYAASVVDKVWGVAASSGYGNYFIMANTDPITDDHYFVNTMAKIPTIDIINYDRSSRASGFADHWHTPNDNINIIDKSTLKAVGQTLINVIFTEQ